jgi:hypothetical protein
MAGMKDASDDGTYRRSMREVTATPLTNPSAALRNQRPRPSHQKASQFDVRQPAAPGSA